MNVFHQTITDFMAEQFGIDPEQPVPDRMEKLILDRCRHLQLPDSGDYLEYLRNSAEEQSVLIDELTVPETWFFRDGRPFDFLRDYLVHEWIPANPGRTLQVLSIPCSTGEEPYSIALTLAALPTATLKFAVTAVDVNGNSLARAEKGIFPRYSFRNNTLPPDPRFFTEHGTDYELNPEFRTQVTFIRGNILDLGLSIYQRKFAVIFCRNLLIYFKPLNKNRVRDLLAGILEKDGLLFVGHAETANFLKPGFRICRYPGAFAFRKEDPASDSGPVKTAAAGKQRTGPTHSKPASSPTADTREKNRILKKRKTGPDPALCRGAPKNGQTDAADLLVLARKKADRGDLDAALKLCREYLDTHRTDADAYALCGTIETARSEKQHAETSFSKALYLNPLHYQALIGLSLLKQEQGRNREALLLRQRAFRVSETAGTGAQ